MKPLLSKSPGAQCLRSSGQIFTAGAILFVVALALRLPRFQQGLWSDEMGTLMNDATGPWRVVVAAKPGEYLPNNHVLYSILAKLSLLVGTGGRMDHPDNAAIFVRLPSLLAGSLVPIAMAWPLRHSAPRSAMLLALLAAAHPWLIAESNEARGYALMVLLGITATNLLPGGNHRWPIMYALLTAAMLYAVLVAAVLVLGHGLFVLVWRRQAAWNWCRGAAMGVGLAVLFYLPMASAVVSYYRHPLLTPDNYGAFVNDLPRFAATGQYLPVPTDPTVMFPDPLEGWEYWLIPVVIAGIGMMISRRKRDDEGFLGVMAVTTIVALAIPIALPAAGQVRFVPWAGLWLIDAVAVILMGAENRWGRIAFVPMALVIGWMIWINLHMPADQPVREAIAIVDRQAPPASQVLVAFLTADGEVQLYGNTARLHHVDAAASPRQFELAERRIVRETGRLPWVIVSYESLVHDFASASWAELQGRYRLVQRLPGRVSPVAIYAPR